MFEKLKQKVDPAELQRRQDEINERIAAQYYRAVARQADLVSSPPSPCPHCLRLSSQVGSNFTLPVTISSVRVLHAKHTRHAFLERVFSPLLSANREASYTLEDALTDIGGAVKKLEKFGLSLAPCYAATAR